MKTIVISLGGSIIVPDEIDFTFLEKFKKLLRKHYRTHKFVIVCGGGSIARKYINALENDHKSKKEISLAGIRVTRLNALFLMQFFGKEANDKLPSNMKEVVDNTRKNKVVICGALRYSKDSTSDSTAAKLASMLKTDFVNMTNIKGLYTKDPRKNKDAKFIPAISWKDFENMALSIKFHAGQHFVLDQNASTLIKNNKIKTYIIDKSLSDLEKIIKGKVFTGTLIDG